MSEVYERHLGDGVWCYIVWVDEKYELYEASPFKEEFIGRYEDLEEAISSSFELT